MACVIGWAFAQLSGGQILTDFREDLSIALAQQLPEVAEETERQALMAEYQNLLERFLDLLVRIWPALVAIGLLAHVGMAFLIVRWLAGLIAGPTGLPVWRPFPQWQVPFYLVWVLVLGLFLIALHQKGLSRVGVNVVLVAAGVFSLQGLAVQVFLFARVCPPWVRIVFWVVAAVFFAPLIFASSVLLGIGDQWLNLRRLPRGRGDLPLP
jgi:hypothetical protein